MSSYQFDQPERGFSFRHTAPLDMRMNQQQALTAAEIINHWDEKELADIFYQYGEERLSRRIAKRIVEKRPFQTTTDLANAIARDVPNGSSIEALRRLDRIIQGIFASENGMIIFPEGGLGITEGELRLPLKRGTAIYALRAGVPIVPVGIIGTQDLYFGKELTLRFGEPLVFPQCKRPKPQEVQAVLDALQVALMDLLPKDYREPPDLKFGRYFLNHLFW